MTLEQRSIAFVPEHERHGRVRDQGPFWFLSNFHFFAMAIGFVGPTLGLSLGYSILAGTLGILIGTLFQAFHASQGPELGLPQMIQSRAQFGYRGVVVPLIAALISLIGYNVVASVILADGLAALWQINRHVTAIVASTLAMALAIWGYDYLHRVFRLLFWISLPLVSILSIAIIGGHVSRGLEQTAGFTWVAFLTQLSSAVSFNVTAAPYVSDYSRYLPTRTPRAAIIFHVFWGSALSAIWLIALGAWLATHTGVSDALLALKQCGDVLYPGIGAALALTSIAALIASMGMNAYSSMLTLITALDSLHTLRTTQSLRMSLIVAIALLWIVVALSASGNAVTYVNGMLVMMLYFLIPWTAVNLIDFFLIRAGSYSIADLFTPEGIYGRWNVRGMSAYLVGVCTSVPFFVVPGVYTGPAAHLLNGVDIGWLVSLIVTSACYLTMSGRRDNLARDANARTPDNQLANTSRISTEGS